jgi:hypothetical protein
MADEAPWQGHRGRQQTTENRLCHFGQFGHGLLFYYYEIDIE